MKADTPKQHRLVELRSENIKKLKAVAVKIDRSLFKISGRNEQGKSSLLDSVAMAIAGPSAFPAEPIRKGQEKAEIFLDFGDLRLTRRIWRKEGGGYGHDVTLDFADGKRPKEKQHVLDALRGSRIADDPIAFARMLPKKRFDMLKQLVPDFDFEEHAEKHREMFEERTAVGRDFEKAQGAAAAIVVPPDAPLRLVDVTELAAELRAASEANALIDKRQQRREDTVEELEDMKDRVEQLETTLAELRVLIARSEKLLAESDALPEKVDVDNLQQKIATAETVNAGARKRAEKLQREAEAKTLGEKYDNLSASLIGLNLAKENAIKQARLPVPELSFGDDDILLDGLPFDQASTARKIRVSTALLMALKPELRVLLVREGSLLDDDARAALEADAVANNFVVLMECVSEEVGAGGVLIEDGEVVS